MLGATKGSGRLTGTRPVGEVDGIPASVTNSAARRPCRYATSTMVASRWP